MTDQPIHHVCQLCGRPVLLTAIVRHGEYRDNVTYHYQCPHADCGHRGTVTEHDLRRGGCERCGE